MNILYLCHRVPYPPNKGEKIRAFHQLAALGQEHQVDLFALDDGTEDAAGYPELERHCRRVVVSRMDRRKARWRALPYLATRKPLTLPYFRSGELFKNIRGAFLQHNYDRIFVYCSAMFQYVEGLAGIPIIVDLVDVDSDKWKQYAERTAFPTRWVYRREAARLREYETMVCRRANCVVVTTAREAEVLQGISSGANTHVIGNGVDAESFRPPAGGVVRSQPTIVFTGEMSYFPNEEAVAYFATSVFPLVRGDIPEARFLIVGRDPTPRVKQLGTLPGVEVTGYVPDVRDYLAKARVAVAPFTIAAGIQNKVLEALASGLPVVATPKVLQGLSKPVAEIIRAGESPEALAAHVKEFLRDPQCAERVGIEGRRRVMSEYNWRLWGERLLDLVREPNAAASGRVERELQPRFCQSP
jgi:sugar transferase (PEP-CTERM/EpsH1 system associated)